MKRMTLKGKSLAILITTVFVASTVFLGIAVPRMTLAQEITESFNFTQDGTNFEMSLLVEDLTAIENAIDVFQYFTADNLEWRGQFPTPEQGEVEVHLMLGTALMENERLFVTDLLLTEKLGGVVDVHVEAENATIELNEGGGDTQLIEIVAVLRDVNFGISMSIIPLSGLRSALYSYSGPELAVTIKIYEVNAMSIESPEEGSILNGVVPVQAEIHTAEGMTVEEVWFKPTWYSDPSWDGHREYIEEDEEDQPMTWNEISGLWEGQWVTMEIPDGEYVIDVLASIVEDSTGIRETYSTDQVIEVENEDWRTGERIRIGGGPGHRNLPADEDYYVAHGWVNWDWYDGMSQQERDDALFSGEIGFELELREPGSDKWKPVDLEYWVQYHSWDYFGTLGEEDFQRQTDVMWQQWYVGFEAGEFEVGETYTFMGRWTWIPDPENPEDTGMWEVIIDITFT